MAIDPATQSQGAPAAAARRRSGLLPLGVAGGLAAAGLLLAGPGSALLPIVPACPFRSLTGLDCPFCGGTRALLALLHGDVGGAADYNLMVTVAAFLSAGLFAWWAVSRILPSLTWPGGALTRSRGLVLGLAAVAAVFWVVRNLPFVPYLGSAT